VQRAQAYVDDSAVCPTLELEAAMVGPAIMRRPLRVGHVGTKMAITSQCAVINID